MAAGADGGRSGAGDPGAARTGLGGGCDGLVAGCWGTSWPLRRGGSPTVGAAAAGGVGDTAGLCAGSGERRGARGPFCEGDSAATQTASLGALSARPAQRGGEVVSPGDVMAARAGAPTVGSGCGCAGCGAEFALGWGGFMRTAGPSLPAVCGRPSAGRGDGGSDGATPAPVPTGGAGREGSGLI